MVFHRADDAESSKDDDGGDDSPPVAPADEEAAQECYQPASDMIDPSLCCHEELQRHPEPDPDQACVRCGDLHREISL